MSNFWARQYVKVENELVHAIPRLLGVIDGILRDGTLDDEEIRFLDSWIEDHNVVLARWPGDAIKDRLEAVLSDGVITPDERKSLRTLLGEIAGHQGQAAVPGRVCSLPFDDVGLIEFPGLRFVLTGDFVFGQRAACKRAIEDRGGLVVGSVSKKVRYVVVGGQGSPEWKYGAFGTKIEKALELRESGVPILLVDEPTWCDNLASVAGAC